MPDTRIVLTTVSNSDDARKIAHTLVEQRLAACVNIVPQVESVYRWQGKVETAGELLLVIKTTAACFPALREALLKAHSYSVPECVMLSVEDGSRDYLAWVSQSTGPES